MVAVSLVCFNHYDGKWDTVFGLALAEALAGVDPIFILLNIVVEVALVILPQS